MDVSVVIPVYNKERYIRRTIESVQNQRIPPVEIIVVDDGSQDGSADVVQSITDFRIRLVQQENAGECAARNRGIAEAQNSLIALLDADDEWKPDFLVIIQRLINNFPNCGAYATSAQIIRPDGRLNYPSLAGLPPEPWIGILPNFFELFQAGYAFNASSVVLPKEVLEEVGGFPEGVIISGDVDCWVKIAIRYPIAFSSSPAVIYHQEAQNRVGNRFLPLLEMPYIQTIQDAIDDGVMPRDLQYEALEFMAQKQIMVATENVMIGNPTYARRLMASCRQTKKYHRDWIWWWIWASLPVGLPKKILNIKKSLLSKNLKLFSDGI